MDDRNSKRLVKIVLIALGVFVAFNFFTGFLTIRLFAPLVQEIEDLSTQPEPKK